MAAQVSCGVSEIIPASPPIAPATSSRTSTRPISKMIARIFLGSNGDYAFSITAGFTAGPFLASRRSRRMLITAGSSETNTTIAIT